MNQNDPIGRVSVVSSGHVQIRPDHLASTWRLTAWRPFPVSTRITSAARPS
jgi:hypothetical protein